MTHCSPLHGTTFSRGRIENSPAQSNQNFILQRLKQLSAFLLLRSPGLALALFAATLAGCGERNHSDHVELVMGSAVPTPATTFELRFESAMAKGDQVGLPATNSPLVIKPHLAGTFTWLSMRSGVFTPTEPLAMNTKYELSLQPGLMGADGQSSDATLRWAVTTPPFSVIATWPQQPADNASSEPECKVAFNDDVRAADAGRFLSFHSLDGQQIPADTKQGTGDDL